MILAFARTFPKVHRLKFVGLVQILFIFLKRRGTLGITVVAFVGNCWSGKCRYEQFDIILKMYWLLNIEKIKIKHSKRVQCFQNGRYSWSGKVWKILGDNWGRKCYFMKTFHTFFLFIICIDRTLYAIHFNVSFYGMDKNLKTVNLPVNSIDFVSIQ